jgi:hypothetical protein
MIRATLRQDTVTFDHDLAVGSSAYVDADWIPAQSQDTDIPALVAKGDQLRFLAGGSANAQTMAILVPSGADLDQLAAAAFIAVACAAAAAAAGSRTAEVSGDGFIAAAARRILASKAPSGHDQRPEAIVEVTGEPDAIAAACARVADLGTVVLAGESGARSAPMNLYTDVHSRGLRLRGVGGPLSGDPGGVAPLAQPLTAPARAHAGEPVALASWYRIDADTG